MYLMLIIVTLISTAQCRVKFNECSRNFSIELAYHTAVETQWHTVISPLGVWTLLTGVTIGATGSSRKQLLAALILPENDKALLEGYRFLKRSVFRSRFLNIDLKSRNYLFIDNNFSMKDNFKRGLCKDFGAFICKFSFKPSRYAAQRANNVIQKYGPEFTNVFTPGDFDNSKMILTNVISFKAYWKMPFNVSDTREEPFYDENGNVLGKVNMMKQKGNQPFSNIHGLEASVLEMPYGDEEISKYSLLIILPHAGITVASVYRHLSEMSLNDIFKKLQDDEKKYGESEVVISVPRFKISSNVILNIPLAKMGIQDIFNPTLAGFNNITEADDIFVSAIVHKADIEVTETGTIASASTSAYYADRTLPATFNANRPFIYFVVEKTTTTIIFSGIYSKPSLF